MSAQSTVDYNQICYFRSSSGTEIRKLSNLHAAPVEISAEDAIFSDEEFCAHFSQFVEWIRERKTARFSGIEAVWHALKALDSATIDRFVIGGDLNLSLEFFKRIVARKDPVVAGRKHAFWSRKCMVGIAPKMASNKTYQTKLQLKGKMDYDREHLPIELLRKVWTWLLTLKYTQNADHRRVLLGTRGKMLVEMDIGGAQEKARVSTRVFWGGWVIKNEEDPRKSTLIGANFMGNLLTKVRSTM